MSSATYDLIVVGSGAAGLTAASVGAAEGLRVLLVEGTLLIGGTTAISGGMVWIPANHKMAEIGIADSVGIANQYLDNTLPKEANRSLRDAFLARGDEMVRYLESKTSLRLRCVRTYPDYYPELTGATAGGRVLEPVPFDGRELGASFKLLRRPLPEFTLFGGMMVSREDIPHFRRAVRSVRSFRRVANLLTGYAVQRLAWPRGTTLYLGNALAARLYKSAIDLGVEIRLNVRVERLLVEEKRVTGIEIVQDGRRVTLRAHRGVVLATGGISHDTELRRRYVPERAGDLSATVNSQSASSGANLALAAGARMREPGINGAFWVPSSRFTRRDGSSAVYPHTVTDRAKPGVIAVDSTGRRFVNEAVSYHEFAQQQLRATPSAIPAYLICDSQFLWKYGLGRIKPFSLTVASDKASGYLKHAPTIEALANSLAVSPQNLLTTVASYNDDALVGVDTAFGRGANIYQRHLGDADRKPNPCMAPIERAPFYAVALYPGDLGMSAGVITDASARALDKEGSVISGLYMCGNDMDSLMAGAYPGPGITLGPALTFAYIAARVAASA